MSQNPAAADWVAARGDKWSRHLSGTEPMLEPVDEPLIQALQLRAPNRIADIGCGAGATTAAILRHAPVGSVVQGFDISPTLIEAARARAGSDERALAFQVADMATAKPEKPYDRLVSRFGVMFFAEPRAAFANLRRWLTPGGRFAFAVWGRLSDNPWMTSVRDVVADVIEMPAPDPAAPGPFRYAESDKLLALLDEAGFGELDASDWRGSLPIGGALSAAEAAAFALASFSSFGELLEKAGDEALDEARRSLTARFALHHQVGAVRMGALVHIVTGTRAT